MANIKLIMSLVLGVFLANVHSQMTIHGYAATLTPTTTTTTTTTPPTTTTAPTTQRTTTTAPTTQRATTTAPTTQRATTTAPTTPPPKKTTAPPTTTTPLTTTTIRTPEATNRTEAKPYAPEGAAPYHAVVEIVDGGGDFVPKCSGAILSAYWVLTHADCVPDTPEKMQIWYDAVDLAEGHIGSVASITKKAPLALLYMPANAPLMLTDTGAYAIRLPDKPFAEKAKPVAVSGFNNFSETRLLYDSSIAVIDASLKDGKSSFLIHSDANRIVDQGSPVVAGEYLVGIAHGVSKDSSPVRVVNVGSSRRWIRAVTSL